MEKEEVFHPSYNKQRWDNAKLYPQIQDLVHELAERKLSEPEFVGAYVLLLIQNRGQWLGNFILVNHWQILIT